MSEDLQNQDAQILEQVLRYKNGSLELSSLVSFLEAMMGVSANRTDHFWRMLKEEWVIFETAYAMSLHHGLPEPTYETDSTLAMAIDRLLGIRKE